MGTAPVFPTRTLLAAALLLTAIAGARAQEESRFNLGLPVDCAMNEQCFFQQFPDLDATAGTATDPWCGGATYDDHDGTDIRVRSMLDVAKGVPVIAVADGKVLGLRDGVPDHLIETDADRQAVADIECGNGVVLDNGDGLETQYCHMRQGSVAVTEGQSVQRGDVLGMVGASGMAQFPHVHLSVRVDGQDVDPTTGHALADGACSMSPGNIAPLWDIAVIPQFNGWEGQAIDMGFATGPIDHASLSRDGAPPVPDSASQAIVAWAWLINLQQGDRLHLVLNGPDGALLSESTTEPLDRNKADYSAFVGKKGAVQPGQYSMSVAILRDGETYDQGSKTLVVE